jgi:hypothetical protein
MLKLSLVHRVIAEENVQKSVLNHFEKTFEKLLKPKFTNGVGT